ncbi:MAG: prepilin-type N-terminal cleavage/methylation domain-containing protein [Candidatus Acidiferrum sp.]
MKFQLKRNVSGFTMIEMMISMAVTLTIMGVAVAAFRQASQCNQAVTYGADMSENLRSGLNMIQLDLQQVGAGIPTNGIPIPFSAPCGKTPGINRPVPPGKPATTFPYPGALTCESTIPSVEPGNMMGPAITAPDATAGTPANPNSITDEITMLYVDNSIGLDASPVNQPATAGPPANAGCPNGSIRVSGTTTTVTFDVNCVNLTNSAPGLITINPGDLIMLTNTNGTALLYVSSVSGQALTFSANDPFKLNGRTETSGTIQQLETGGAACGGGTACFPPTLATRIWMISYYLDNLTSPGYTRLIRQVNFNTPSAVGETLENLQFTYNYVDGATNPANQPSVPAGNSESNIKSVNVYLGARSSHGVQVSGERVYARSNLSTQVGFRSLAHVNRYK